MAHWLRILRNLVKLTAVIISIAFLINSVNGIFSTIALADGDKINQRPVQPGDFEINYGNKTINIGILFNNTLFYDLEDIIFHVTGVVAINRTLPNPKNITIIDVYNNGTKPDEAGNIQGYTIKSGEAGEIGIHVEGDEAVNMTPLFDYLGINPATWDITDFIQNPNLLGLYDSTFEVFLTVEFSVSYAFGQYKIHVKLELSPQTFNLGLGI